MDNGWFAITPHYRGEREPAPPRSNPYDLILEVEQLAKKLMTTKHDSDLIDVAIMAKPRWTTIIRKNWWSFFSTQEDVLATKLTTGRLFVFETHVRTYGLSPTGEIFVMRIYDEIPAGAFCSEKPLVWTGLNEGVIRGELKNTLSKLLQEAVTPAA